MDLWDVTKVMVRRWYVALPVLVVTAIAALWTTSTVKPDYEATTNVTLLPPTVRNDTNTGRQQTVNPWDTESLTVAILTYLNAKRLHDQMDADGYSDVWEADTDMQFRTLIIIKVTASGQDQAQATARKLQELVTAEVQRQQDAYPLKPGEEITTIPFDNGDNLETKRSKAKRALIVVVGVGFILAIALAVGLDALLRWRSGRGRRGGQPAAPTSPDGGPSLPSLAQPPTGSAEPIVIRTVSATTAGPARPPAKAAGGDGRSSDETQPIKIGVQYKSGGAEADVDISNRVQSRLEPLQVTEDATIVLPLSNAPWAKSGKGGDKGTQNGKR